MKTSEAADGSGSAAGSTDNGTTISTGVTKQKPLFNADLHNESGKIFEFTGNLFIPLPGEFDNRPSPPPINEQVTIAKEEKGLFVPKSMQTHFQKDFNKTVKMDPLFGERIRTRESSVNDARRLLAGVAVVRKKSSY